MRGWAAGPGLTTRGPAPQPAGTEAQGHFPPPGRRPSWTVTVTLVGLEAREAQRPGFRKAKTPEKSGPPQELGRVVMGQTDIWKEPHTQNPQAWV